MMPTLIGAFFSGGSSLEVTLAVVAIVALAFAGGSRLFKRGGPAAALVAPTLPKFNQPRPEPEAEVWDAADAIVFPTDGPVVGGDFDRAPLGSHQAGDIPEGGPFSAALADGLDELAIGGDRVVEAFREHPVEYMAGALAAGFVAGVLVPMLSARNKTEKMLERLLKASEERERRQPPRL